MVSIRTLTTADVSPYRAIRLRALQQSPTAFLSSYEQEVLLSEADFLARMLLQGDPANGLFGAFTSDETLVGILGFIRENRPKRTHIATLVSMYVAPEVRGQGIGGALLDTALQRAQSLGLRHVLLSVTAGNIAASRLYTSRGFERYGIEPDALYIEGRFYDEEYLIKRFSNQRPEVGG